MSSFIRTKENFNCEVCGHHVVGTGYTNHCPKCLWSKHVDANPGDRDANCDGMMRPVRAEKAKGDAWDIVHRCERCGQEKHNKAQKEDDWDVVVSVQYTSG